MTKKILIFVVWTLWTAAGSLTAAVPAASVAVGGLAPYATMDYVKGVYGEPGYVAEMGDGDWLCTYMRHTTITFTTEKKLRQLFTGKDEGSDKVFLLRRIDVKPDSMMATPAGITFGMGEADLLKAYGKPDLRVLSTKDYEVRYMYVGEPKSEYEGLCFMTFDLADGKITHISCYATRH